MSTTTATFDHIAADTETRATAAKAAPRKGFFERFMEVRMMQARARVRDYLGHLSDTQLTDIGFTADQIRDLRGNSAFKAGYLS